MRSPDGTAWDFFPHDHARSKAYRWGEDGANVAIAEIPARPRDLILNGWQTALVSIHRYAQLSDSPAARQLFEESSHTAFVESRPVLLQGLHRQVLER